MKSYQNFYVARRLVTTSQTLKMHEYLAIPTGSSTVYTATLRMVSELVSWVQIRTQPTGVPLPDSAKKPR